MRAERAATSLLTRTALAVAVASCFPGYALANPTNPTVISGAATFAASGKTLNVTNTPGAIINWQGFSVKADELTRFIQQNAQSAVLNRVTSQEQSAILGQLLSNGRVYLINPNGITVGAGARIDTAGFVASSLNLSDSDALAGKFKLHDTGSSGKVVNNGTITTASGGFVYLVAPNVENNGIITSPRGEIILAAGKSVELIDSQRPELRVLLTAPENTAVNVGKLIAEAGSIGIFAGAIRQSGLVSANSAAVGENGKIVFKANRNIALEAGSSTTANGPSGGSIAIQSDAGTATIAGVVEANGTQGKGGTIAVAAAQGVTVGSTARVAANGSEGGSVTLASSAGSVTVSAPVSANATSGVAGQIAVNAATMAALVAGQLSASGGLGGGAVSIRGGGGVTLDADSLVRASGVAGGAVSIASAQGAIAVQGKIDVTGTDAAGGNVRLAALSDITIDIASQILASGRRGGEVYIESGEGTLLSSGLIDGQGNDGQGGRVLLLAPRVGLIREAVVDVSGSSGGGTVLVGGDFQGKNPGVQNASRTYVGGGAAIKADAITVGDGGKVVVWADGDTRYYGSITARGGEQGGEGGRVEVSGKHALDFHGKVDLSAPRGIGGTLLLDPEFIVLDNSTQTPPIDNAVSTPDVAFADPPDPGTTTIEVGDVVGFSELFLQATKDITLSNDLTMNAGNSVRFEANRDIKINANLTVSGAATVKLTADADGNGTGAITQGAAGNTITQAAGTLTFAAGTGITATTNAPTISFTNSVTSGSASGDVSITDARSGTLTISGSNATSAGKIIVAKSNGDVEIGASGLSVPNGVSSVELDAASQSIKNTAGGTLTANTVKLGLAGATTGVGVSGTTVLTQATTINATAGSGGVFITESDAVSLGTISSVGVVQISNTTGDMTVGTVTATGAVTLTATAGSIQDDANDASKVAGSAVTLNAVAGAIGATAATNEIDTNTASLTLNAGTDVYVANTTTGLTTLDVTVRPDATGTQSYNVSDSGLTFTLAEATSGAVDLTNISNSGLNLKLTNAASTGGNINVATVNVVTGNVTLVSNAGALVNATSTVTSGTVTLTASSGGVGASGQAINTTAATINATAGSGGIYLIETNGADFTVNATDGPIQVTSSNSGTLNIAGNSAAGTGTIVLSSADAVSVAAAIATTSGSVILEAGGAITLQTNGTITTTGASNTTSGSLGGAGGEIFIHHTSATAADITLGKAVTAAGGSAAGGGATGGNGGTITVVNDDGRILVNAALDASGGAAGTVAAGNGGTIQLKTANPTAAAGAITQTAAITATGATGGSLAIVSASDTVTLQNASNDVAKLAASVTMAGKRFNYTDANSVAVDTITAGTLTAPSGTLAAATTTGITTQGGAGGDVKVVVLGTGSAGTLNVSQAISTVPATAVAGGAVVLEAGGAITLQTSGTITTTGGAGGATGAVGGEVFIHHTGTTANAITLNKSITAKGGTGTSTGGDGAVVTVQNDNGTIVFNAGGAVNVSGGAATTQGNGGTIQLVSAGSSSAISQTGASAAEALLATGATGGALKVNSADTVTLQNSTNDMRTLAANVSTAGKGFNYTDANSLDVGTVTAAGSVSAPASPAGSGTSASQAAMSGITTQGGTGGDVKLVASGTGALTVDLPISTAPSASSGLVGGAVVLEAGGAITLALANTGTISTTGDGSATGGDVFIHHTNAGPGLIDISRNITAKGGASGAGGAVTIKNDSGAISINATVDVSRGASASGADGSIALYASGDITDTTSALFQGDTNGSLKVWSTGGRIALTQGATVAGTAAGELGDSAVGHQMATVALKTDTTGTDGSIRYLDRTDLTVSSVAAGASAPVTPSGANPSNVGAVAGVTTVAGGTNGAVMLRSGMGATANTLTVNQAIATTPSGTAVGGSVILEAGGAITLTAGNSGTITTTGNGANAGGEVFIHHSSAAAGDITLGKNITATGGAGGNGGVVTVLNDAGTIAVNAAIDVSKAGAGTADGSIQLKATGDIVDSAAGGLIGDLNGKLKAYSTGGKIDLSSSTTHAMKNASFLTDTTTASTNDGSIKYFDTTDLTLTKVANGLGTLTSPAGTSANLAATTKGAVTLVGGSKGAVTIRAGTSAASTLDVDEAILTTPGGTATVGGSVILEAGGAITLMAGNSGTITTTGNGSGSGGEIFIHHTSAGVGDITLGRNISATGGASGNGGVVTVLNDSGNIVVGATMDVSKGATGTADGTIQLQATESISDNASGKLIGDASGKLVAKTTNASGTAKISLVGNGTSSLSTNNAMANATFATATSGDGSITYYDSTGLAIGTVGGEGALSGPAAGVLASSVVSTSGVRTVAGGTANGKVVIAAGTTNAHTLTIDQAINTTPRVAGVAGGTVTLEATGAITLTAGNSGTITTTGNGSGSGGEIFLHHTSVGTADITLGRNISATGGASGNGAVVTVLNDSGNININSTLDVSKGDTGTTDGTIQLQATESITDNASGKLIGDANGKLVAKTTNTSGTAKISLVGNGTSSLSTNNAMATATFATATNGDGSITYYDSTGLAIGTVGGEGALSGPAAGVLASSVASTSGIRTVAGGTASGKVVIAAGTTNAHGLTIDQAINTTPGTAGVAGGTVTLEATGAITLTAGNSGTITTTGNGSGSGGEIFIHHTSAGAGDITLGKNISATGGASGNGGVVTVLNDSGNINVNATIDVSKGSTGTTDGTIQLQATESITDNATGKLIGDANGKLVAKTTNASGTAKISLVGNGTSSLSTNNAMATATFATATSGDGSITYYDSTGLAIGTVGGQGALSGPAAGVLASSVASTSGITTVAGGTVAGKVVIAAGTTNAHGLTVDQAINTTPGVAGTAGGTVTLEATGAITTSNSGTITTTGNGSGAGGEVFIHHTSAGAGDITLGKNVGATGGASGNGGVITVLNDNGNILVGAAVDVTGASGTDSTIQLQATESITDNASGKLIGDTNGKLVAKTTNTTGTAKISLVGNGTSSLSTNNAMVNAAFTTATSADGSITYYDSTGLTIGTVGGQGALSGPAAGVLASSVSSTSGVTTVAGGTANGKVVIGAGTTNAHALTIDQAINTTPGTAATAGGTVTLEATGAITLTAANSGTITTTGNTSGSGGEIFIHHTNAGSGPIDISRTITARGGAGGAGGAVTITNDSGAISINATVDVSRGASFSGADGSIALYASGDITDTTSALLQGDSNGSLKVWSTGGKIALTQGATVAGTAAGELGDSAVGHQMATVALKTDTTGTDGSIRYLDRTDLTVSTVAAGANAPVTPSGADPSNVGAVSGVTTVAGGVNGAVMLRAGMGASANTLTVNQAIATAPGAGSNLAGGAVSLEAAGAITSTGTMATTGDGSGAGGAVFVHHTNAAAGTITLSGNLTASGGASGSGGAVTVLNDSGAIVIDATLDVSKGTGNDGSIALKATGNITDTSLGLMKGDTDGTLKAWSTGGVIRLTNGAAATGTGAGTLGGVAGHQMKTVVFKTDTTGADGSVTYADASDVTVDTVGTGASAPVAASGAKPADVAAVTGVTTVAGGANGAVMLRAGTSAGTHTLTINTAVATTPTAVATDGGGVILEAGGAIVLQTNGTITTTGNTTGAGGEVFIHHGNAAAGDITLGNNITARGGAGGNGGVVTVLNDAGNILINAAIDASGGGGGNGGTIQLVSAGASSAITQTGTTSASALLASGTAGGLLKINAADTVTLLNPSNDVQTLAANVNKAGKSFAYAVANSLDVSAVAAAGALIAPSGAAAAQTVMNGIVTDGNVNVTAFGSGDLTVLKDVIKSGITSATTLTLQANRNVIFNNGASAKLASGASGSYAMVLNSDLDQATASGGAIQLNSGSVLDSNGGDITLGGGATPASLAAIGTGALIEGVELDNAQLLSGAGSISVRGTGLAGTSNAVGILISNGSVVEGAGAGTITFTGTGGMGSSSNHGIRVSNATVRSTQTGNISMSGVGAGSGLFNSGILVDSGGVVTATQTVEGGGSISLTGTGGGGADGANYGVGVASGSTVSSLGGGTIALNGTGGTGAGNGDIGVFVTGADSKVSSADGAIQVTGTAAAGGGNLDSGVAITDGGTIQSTGTATISVTGAANAASASNNRGVLMTGTVASVSSIASVTGAIVVVGVGAGSGSNNTGVDVSRNSVIESSGSATISLTGTGGAGTSGNDGVHVTGAGSRVTSTAAGSGAIKVVGTGGAGSTTGNSGAVVDGAGRIESLAAGSAGTIAVTGTGGLGTGSNYGVAINGASSTISSAGGTINVTGIRGSATGADNYGIFVNNSGLVEYSGSGSGNQLVMLGGGAATGTDDNHGIRVSNATVRATQTGNISLTGTGAGSGAFNSGMVIDSGGVIELTQAADGGGSIALIGTGGNGSGGANIGVGMTSAAIVRSLGNGAISVSGSGGAGSGDADAGVLITDAGTRLSSNNGAISVSGLALAGGGNADAGVVLQDGAKIDSTGGATIGVTGTAKAGSASNNRGIYVREAIAAAGGGSISSLGGNITLVGTGDGTGSNNTGITLENSSTIQSTTGAITLAGASHSAEASLNDGIALTSASGTTRILSSSGAIQLKGTKGVNGTDIRLANNPTLGDATAAASSSDILIEAVGNTGITTDANIASSGSVTLNASAGGVIAQTGGQIVATGGANSALRLLGNAATSTVANLTSASNDINVLVVNLPGATSTLSYRDANGFNIGSLSKPIVQGGGSVNHDGITVGTAAGAADNTLMLNAFGAVTQTQPITAGALQLLGGTGVSYTLAQALNDITTLAASTAGPISYRDANSYAVGTVSSTNQFSAASIPTGSATNGTTETGAAGAFSVTTVGVHTTAGGTLQLDVPGTLTIDNNINTDGAFSQISTAGTGAVSVTGPRLVTTTADNVSFDSPVALNGAGTTTAIDTSSGSGSAIGANMTFNNTVNGTNAGGEQLTITAGSGGNVTFNGAVGQTTRLGDVLITNANDVTLQAAFNAKTLTQQFGTTGIAPNTSPSGGTSTINGAVDTAGNTSFTTSGSLTVTGAGSITTGAGSTVALTTSGDMTISGSVTAPAGATLNVIGTDRTLTHNGGTLATSDSAVALIADEMMLTSAINAGSGAVTLKPNNTADAIQLGVAAASSNNSAATLELANNELNTITTTGGLTLGAANNTGAITVVGALTPTTAQNGFTLLNNTGGIAINAPVTYAAGNGNMTLSANGGGAAAGAISTNGSSLDVNGTLAMNAATGVGTLASPMVLSHASGTTLTVTNTTSGGVFERADTGDLNVTSISNSAAANGGINLNVGTNLNIIGLVSNTVGDIQLVTGNDAAYAGANGFDLSPASVAAGTLGGVNLNGQVIADNGGAISIFATGAVKQSTSAAAGLQSIPVKDTVKQGTLKVRTFNSGTQVGVIDLQNNLADSGNSMGPITLEARLAGSINPPPYAESNIDYKSINGTSISGIGTAADFALVAPSQTISLAPGASLSGTNVSLIATAGDVTVESAITNAQINGGQTGGSLNLYATGNIVLNNPGGDSAGVVIGRDLGTLDKLGNREFEKFDHTLKLVATGDVRIHGTVQVTGDLALRANASASEASGSGASAGFGAGTGSVIIAGSAGNPVEIRANNIVVGVKDADGNPLPVKDLIIDNSANGADNGKFNDSTLSADKKLDIYLNGDQGGAGTSGNIVVTGGSASATSSGIAGTATKSSALAVVRGEDVTILGVKGGTQVTLDPDTQTVNPLLPYTGNSSNITVTGGTATSNAVAGGGALAAADALILGTKSKFIDIGGNIVLTGGTANSTDGGQTSAAAKIDPVNLRINTGGYIKLIGGEGGGARAAIVNSGDMEIRIGGKLDYTYTDATGTHTVPDVGMLLVGGTGSGLFDRNNLPIKLYYDVSAQVLLLFPAINGGAGGGSYFLHTDAAKKATAFVQSLSPRGFEDSLMAYIIFAANEETRTGRINTGTSNTDDLSKPSCN